MKKRLGARRLLVVVSIVAAGTGLAAAPVAAVPGLTVTPATGLLDQQVVTVTSTGFTPDEDLLITQCAGVAPAGCVLDPPMNTNGAYVTADATGAIDVTLRLPRVLELESADVSCADGGCAIVALTREGHEERARTAIDFETTGTAPPPPDAQLAITASDMRADGAQGHLTGSGYLPWFQVSSIAFDVPVPISIGDVVPPGYAGAYVSLCTPPPSGWAGCDRFVSPQYPVGSSGSFFRYHEVVPVRADGTLSSNLGLPRMWITRHGRVDCAVSDCSFALEQDGAPHSNVVDVAWAPEWSPWPSASAFVGDAYRALMGRTATAKERSTAIAALTNRSTTGFALLRQLAARSDARPLAEIGRLYQAALNRRPDANGLVYWESELRRTGSMSSIATAFGRTPEFRASFGPSVSNAQAVTNAYWQTLGRGPSNGERDYWVGRLQAGLARTHMIHLFSRTQEFLAREAGRSQVAAITVALLRRGPTSDEWYLASPDGNLHDQKTVSDRADDGVLRILSSNQLKSERS